MNMSKFFLNKVIKIKAVSLDEGYGLRLKRVKEYIGDESF